MSRHQLAQHHGGWVPQRPDQRDFKFIPTVHPEAAPSVFEIFGVDHIPVLDQGQQGSCTGHGPVGPFCHALQFLEGVPFIVPSPAMIYYDARIPEGTTDQDSGASVRDAVAGIVKWGACSSGEMPYSDQVYNVAPTAQQYADAKKSEALVYQATDFPHLNATIASGFPIVYGFTVYESFESDPVAQTGAVPVPAANEGVLGGHCVYMFGYNATRSPWTSPSGLVYPPRSKACRNSWSSTWGDHGNFFMPQWYFSSGDANASDFWVINRVGAGS